MNEPIHGPIPRIDFQQWLEKEDTPLVVSLPSDYIATMLKISKTQEIDYLYGASTHRAGRISWDNGLTFCGAYDRRSQTLYLSSSPLTAMVSGITEAEQDSSNLLKSIREEVNRRVEDVVANDRNNLSIKAVTGWNASRDLEYYLEHGVKEHAIRSFFAGQEPDGQFHSNYILEGFTEAAFIAWLQDPEKFIQGEADQYLNSHQEAFLMGFIKNDALLKEYQALMRDTANPIHKMKAITDAVKASGAKTVTVTVQRDGQELTFKAAARSLIGHKNYYNTYDIPAQDRREFEQMFGRHADYTAEDITKITYGKNTIYEAAAPAEEQTVSMGMGGMSL